MAIRDPQSVYRRNSQRAPFPGSGARVQNAALAGALAPQAGAIERPSTPEEPPRVVPSEPNVSQPAVTPAPTNADASTQPTSPYAGRWGYETIRNAYRNYLGREGSEAEYLAHLGGGRWAGDYDPKFGASVNSAVQSIYNSPEALAYRKAQEEKEKAAASGGGGSARLGGPQDAAQRMAQFAGQRIGKVFGNAGPASQSQTPPEKVLTPELQQLVADIVGAPFGAARTPQQPVASPMQMASEPAPASAPALDSTGGVGGANSPYGAAGAAGFWNSNYEWTPAEGGPKVSDLLGKVGDPSRLSGFNTSGWGSGERGTESSKNAFGMIASRYDPRDPQGLDKLLADPDFQAFWPNAKKVGHDKIDFGDGMPVDVLINSIPGQGGESWAYQPPGGGGGFAPPAGASSSFPTTFNPSDPNFASKLLAYLMEQLGV